MCNRSNPENSTKELSTDFRLSAKKDCKGEKQTMNGAPPDKGLLNRPGQNNCFLNVCIQALWHLDSFRSKFLSSGSHVHNGASCIYCALKVHTCCMKGLADLCFHFPLRRVCSRNISSARSRFFRRRCCARVSASCTKMKSVSAWALWYSLPSLFAFSKRETDASAHCDFCRTMLPRPWMQF